MNRTGVRVVPSLLFAVVCVLLALPAAAQGKMTGMAKDNRGQPLKDVEILLKSIDSSIPDTRVKTNKKGKFTFGLMRNGTYRLLAFQDGMRMKAIDANCEERDDESLWAFDNELEPGQDPPQFRVTGVSIITYDVVMEPHDGDVGQWGTGVPISPTGQVLTLVQAEKYDDAIAAADKFIARTPGDATLHYLKAFCLRIQGDVPGALTSANEAVRLSPRMEGVHLLQGKLLADQGDLDGALVAFEKETGIAERTEVKRDAYLDMAIAYIKKQDLDGAVRALEAVLEIAPENIAAAQNLADIYIRQGETAKAEALMTQIADMGAQDPMLLYNLGAQRFNDGKFEEAASFFQKTINADPNFKDAYRQLAFTNLNMGNRDGAISNLEKFLELSGGEDDGNVQSARAMLEQLKK